MYQWRKFQFFEDRTPSGPLADELKVNLTCSSSGRGQIAFGSEDGQVHVVDRGLQVKYSFEAHHGRVVHIQQLKQRNILVTAGEEDTTPAKLASTTLKLWDLDRFTDVSPANGTLPAGSSKVNAPSCIRSLKVFPSKFPESKITAFSALEEAPPVLLVAIGLESGHVYLIRGDVSRERVARIKVAVDPSTDGKLGAPLTGLGFRLEGTVVQLFAVTTEMVVVFNMGQQQAPVRTVLDNHGCEMGCAAMSDSQELIVGRPEAVYVYDADGRGPCWVFEGQKRQITWFRGYLLSLSADARNGDKSVLTIYDLKNKLIVYSLPVGSVSHVVCEWGMVLVLTTEGKVICLGEKDMGSKLELLFKKKLYTVAINLVQSQNADSAATAEVMRKYGDHLYSKQDYDEAMAQYLRTIGHLEPSYVIQKFLDAQRIHSLTCYLEKLHEKGLATADHTTLLLNCYTKLKDVAKLDQFIKGEDGTLSFDVETAVRVCRAAGYYEHALHVAKKVGEHEWYLKILLEDVAHYDEALAYIEDLPFYDTAVTLKQYGNILVRHRPQKVTEILMELCAGVKATRGGGEGEGAEKEVREGLGRGAMANGSKTPGKKLMSPMDFVHIYVNQPSWLMRFLEQYLEEVKDSAAHSEIHNTLLEFYLAEEGGVPPFESFLEGSEAPVGLSSSVRRDDTQLSSSLPQKETTADETEPSSFSKAPDSASLRSRLREEKTKMGEGGSGGEGAEREVRLRKAGALLRSAWSPQDPKARYDADLAIVLCQMHDFKEGLLFLYEKLKLHKEVMACYMKDGDYKGLIACCKRLGDVNRGGDPHLWSDLLAFLGDNGEECATEVREVLDLLEREELMPPLMVLQALARNPKLTLGVVRDYVARQIKHQTRMIEEDRQAIEKYQEETAAMKAEILELKTKARIFQLSKCTACSYALDLPAVHFLCMHSFHQRCLGDNESECPVCAPGNRTVLEMRRNLEQHAGDHDRFFQLVQNSDDGFSVIAEYFGRGILNKAKPGTSKGGARGLEYSYSATSEASM